MIKPQNGSIYLAFVKFKDQNQGKARPVLIFKMSGRPSIALKLTSKFANKPDYLKRVFYRITDWRAAGLDQPTWVDTAFKIDTRALTVTKLVGKLTNVDIKGLKHFYQTLKSDDGYVHVHKPK
ncbi:hypothetical protein [Lacticaseibacillus songhuajiangensis]|jgi:hypothetical protein|uniref:hypothetical protein n=1 Tax=Lacticaseibacillus songhuajiangensis TaxID=1296539 RepID=UPI000F76DFF6|nr:hypothetical protein [Lacticaseibacillus songhuajiangensis]